MVKMKKFLSLVLAFILSISLCACGGDVKTTLGTPIDQEQSGPRLTFIADFYDNNGTPWLSVEGSTFNISPNKVKEYSYDSSGAWISQWVMSSVMTVEIDNSVIQSCGSTVIFADTSLKKYDIEIPAEATLSDGGNSAITVPGDLQWRDYWSVQFWWKNHQGENQGSNSRIVVVQSQTGAPICMYMGNDVTWEVAKNLPKTTLIHIDGKALYIHRANFALIDTSVFGG